MLWWTLRQLRSSDWRKRQRAIASLSSSGDPRAVPHLIALLSDTRGSERPAAAAALGMTRDTRAIEALTEALSDDDWILRKSAVSALGEFRDIVGHFKDKHVESSLVSMLEDPMPAVRQTAANVLSTSNTPETIEALRVYSAPEEELKLKKRISALVAGLAGELQAAGGGGLYNNSDPHSVPAFKEIVELNSSAVSPLCEILNQHPISHRQWVAALALGALRDTRALPILADLLDDNSHNLGPAVETVLRDMGRAITKYLEPKVINKDGHVNRNVVNILNYVGWWPTRDEHQVSLALIKEDWGTIINTGGSLAESLIRDTSNIYFASALALAKDHRCIAMFGRILSDSESNSSHERRIRAAQELGRLRDRPEAADPLVKLISSKYHYYYLESAPTRPALDELKVREEAVRSLGKLGAPSAVKPLITLITPPEGKYDSKEELFFCQTTVEALEKILEQAPADIPADDLTRLAEIKDVDRTRTYSESRRTWSSEEAPPIPCDRLRVLAREELAKRRAGNE